MGPDARRDAWAELVRTAALVRVAPGTGEIDPGRPRLPLLRCAISVAVVMVAAGLAFNHLLHATLPAAADSSADASLFALTNQDRASNGVHALSASGTLQNIGESARYTGCGFTIFGRSDDMIQRNYFAHPILNCGQLVFSIMHAYGVNYRLAGENIGWTAGAGDGGASASYVNGKFMISPEHKANILNASYTHLGIGSWPTAAWHYSGCNGCSDVWMFSEEFAQLGSPPPPAAKPPPPTARPAPRNSPAPPAPGLAPATSAPLPTPTPIPVRFLPSYAPPPPITTYEGLLPNSVESVLEAFLVD